MKHIKVWQRVDCSCQARVSRRGLSERSEIAFCQVHAAAPQMLKALKEAKVALEARFDGCCLVSVLEAIAKAEGK